MRPTVRLRLTLAYGGLFLLAGAVLLALNYGLTKRSLDSRPPSVILTRDLFFQEPVLRDGRLLTEALDDQAAQLRQETLDRLLRQSVVALGLMAVASVGLGYVVADRVLRPLADITATARRLSGETLHERIRMTGPQDELKELADTFDGMLERLDAAFESQRRFVANASHELRTPLAVMRTEVDVTLADPDATPAQLRAMGETVREATERSERLVDALLLLARSERGGGEREPADLAVAAGDAIDAVRRELTGLRLTTSLEPAPVTGDRALLDRLVANLVENAVRHNEPGGWLEVSTGTRDGKAWVGVRNGGTFIAPESVDGLFEPFRRLAGDRTRSDRGAGLGLSIVRAVVTAHGGKVTARSRTDGGLDIWAELPVTLDR